MKISPLLSSLFLVALVQSALAQPLEPVFFIPELLNTDGHNLPSDWDVNCDNRGTCRAAGYQSDYFDDEHSSDYPISVLLVREAGKPEIYTQLSWDTTELPEDPNRRFALKIGNQQWQDIAWQDGGIELSTEQSKALLANVHTAKPNVLTLESGQHQWHVSSFGMLETLREMDTLQDFSHTQSALVERGTQAEPTQTYQYPTLKPAAVEKSPPQYLSPKSQRGKTLAKLLQQSTDSHGDPLSDCAIFSDELQESYLNDTEKSFEIFRLNEQSALVLGLCHQGAYQSSSVAWVMNSELSEIKQIISEGVQFYEDGQLHGGFKARGIGDCWFSTEYTWNGNTFEHTYQANTGQCKGVAGGFWSLPELVIEVEGKKREFLINP